MERQITPGVKRQIKALRKKYCSDICSDFYMKTGIPRIVAERMEQFDEDAKPLKKDFDKKQKKAVKQAIRKGKRTKEEDKLIFV